MVSIFDPACALFCMPPWTKELVYCCPSTFSLTSPPPPKLNVQPSVWLCGGGAGGGGEVLNCAVDRGCRPYSAGVLHFYTDLEPTKKCFTNPNKNDQ